MSPTKPKNPTVASLAKDYATLLARVDYLDKMITDKDETIVELTKRITQLENNQQKQKSVPTTELWSTVSGIRQRKHKLNSTCSTAQHMRTKTVRNATKTLSFLAYQCQQRRTRTK